MLGRPARGGHPLNSSNLHASWIASCPFILIPPFYGVPPKRTMIRPSEESRLGLLNTLSPFTLIRSPSSTSNAKRNDRCQQKSNSNTKHRHRRTLVNASPGRSVTRFHVSPASSLWHISFATNQEVFRVLALRRRDLDIVAGVSPELLQPAVVKSFWMFEVGERVCVPGARPRHVQRESPEEEHTRSKDVGTRRVQGGGGKSTERHKRRGDASDDEGHLCLSMVIVVAPRFIHPPIPTSR